MVGYNQNQPDVWGSFAGGLEIGGALRRRQQQDAYGEAYQQNGFEGVRDAAGGFGDIQTAQSAQGTLDEQEETALARATRSATIMANAASSLQGVPYEQRWQMLDRMEPVLEPLGITPDQLRQFDPTDENLAMIMSMPSQFEQFTEIRNAEDGAIVGITRNGQTQVLREAPPPAWQQIPQDQLPQGARFGQRNTRTGEADLDWAPQGGSGGSGGVQYRPMTAEEAQQYGLPSPEGMAIGSNGIPRRVGGGGTFGPDQRARVAISYDAALEASRFLEQADAQAVQRQGSHVSDTPLGQDWLARAAEAIPFDGGTVARMVGGEDYQQYVRASSAFEAAMLPILSGAAVTESEAQRIVRAALPRQGDDQPTLAAKARQRRQMLNGAAMIGGRPPPFPEDGAPDWVSGARSAPASGGASPGMGLENMTYEELDALEAELMNRQ